MDWAYYWLEKNITNKPFIIFLNALKSILIMILPIMVWGMSIIIQVSMMRLFRVSSNAMKSILKMELPTMD
jgi:hypothetical protein